LLKFSLFPAFNTIPIKIFANRINFNKIFFFINKSPKIFYKEKGVNPKMYFEKTPKNLKIIFDLQ